jgi:hypothetical protein
MTVLDFSGRSVLQELFETGQEVFARQLVDKFGVSLLHRHPVTDVPLLLWLAGWEWSTADREIFLQRSPRGMTAELSRTCCANAYGSAQA